MHGKAPVEREITFKGYEDVKAGIVKWPMSVIRISTADKDRLIDLADKILLAWRGYTDEAAFVYAETDGEPHNTITPIARRRGDAYELDLVLRNNITTEEHPLGVYHPHAKLHHIKKENIGLIEVMGLAVLPARLKDEMADLEQAIGEIESVADIDMVSRLKEEKRRAALQAEEEAKAEEAARAERGGTSRRSRKERKRRHKQKKPHKRRRQRKRKRPLK